MMRSVIQDLRPLLMSSMVYILFFFYLFTYLFTVELRWLEHLWDYEDLFETRVIRANECLSQRQVRRHNMDIFSNFEFK